MDLNAYPSPGLPKPDKETEGHPCGCSLQPTTLRQGRALLAPRQGRHWLKATAAVAAIGLALCAGACGGGASKGAAGAGGSAGGASAERDAGALAVAVEDSVVAWPEEEEINDFSLRADGVGPFLMGSDFSRYSTEQANEAYLSDTLRPVFTFVTMDVETDEQTTYSAFYRLDNEGNTMLALYGGAPQSPPELAGLRVKGIYVYGPDFCTADGIHPGMPVRELVSDHQGSIVLHQVEGSAYIDAATVSVPGCKGMTLLVDLGPLETKHGGFAFLCSWDYENNCQRPNFRQNLEEEIRSECNLGCVIVGDFYNLTLSPEIRAVRWTPDLILKWVQGTWIYHASGLGTSKLVFDGDQLTSYFNGKVNYRGPYTVEQGRINYGKGFYIDVDERNRWLKFSELADDFYGKLEGDRYVYPNFTGFNSMDEVWAYLATKRNFSRMNPGKHWVKTLTLEGNRMLADGVEAGEVGYDSRDQGVLCGHRIRLILRSEGREYSLGAEANGGRISCLYFAPVLMRDPLGLPFYQYFDPMISSGRLNLTFSTTDGPHVDHLKVYKFIAH